MCELPIMQLVRAVSVVCFLCTVASKPSVHNDAGGVAKFYFMYALSISSRQNVNYLRRHPLIGSKS